MYSIFRICFVLIAVSVLGWTSRCSANEVLRIGGMGGTRIALNTQEDAGVLGNPAGLINVPYHILALSVSTEDISWTTQVERETQQFEGSFNADIHPAVYYSKALRGWGFSLGYVTTFKNFAHTMLETPHIEYDPDNRRFSATADLATDYDFFSERTWIFGLSRRIGKAAVGARLKRVTQTENHGMVMSTGTLEAQHARDVRLIADESIPTIIEELTANRSSKKFEDELFSAVVEDLKSTDWDAAFEHDQNPFLERTVAEFDLDLGFQYEFWLVPGGKKSLHVGIICENLFQPESVNQHSRLFGLGVAYDPKNWWVVSGDVWRQIGQSRIDAALGCELYITWQGVVENIIALRGGFGTAMHRPVNYVDTEAHLSLGALLKLGTLALEYTYIRPLDVTPMQKVRHLFGVTLQF